jgi:hypothetical protein
MKLDVEVILKNIKETLLEKLNPKLLEIEADKGDGIVLKPIDPGAYILQSLDEFPINYDPALFYGIESIETVGEYSSTHKSIKVEISFIIADPQDGTIFSRLFRYQRALEETFLESYFTIKNMREKVKVTSLEPVAFKVQNSTSEFKAIGVMIEISLFT